MNILLDPCHTIASLADLPERSANPTAESHHHELICDPAITPRHTTSTISTSQIGIKVGKNMFFKALRSRRHSSKDSCSVCDKTSMPSDSPSHRHSQPSCAHTGSHSTSHTQSQSQSQDGSTSAGRTDYEVFLEKARREEEERARIRQQEIRDAERRRREFTLDPWAGKI